MAAARDWPERLEKGEKNTGLSSLLINKEKKNYPHDSAGRSFCVNSFPVESFS